MDASLPNFKVGEAVSLNMSLDDSESSSMVLNKDNLESVRNPTSGQEKKSRDDSDDMVQNQSQDCIDFQTPSISESKDVAETMNSIDTLTASTESTNKERSPVQNDLSAKALANDMPAISLECKKAIQSPVSQTQCVGTDSESTSKETQCTGTETLTEIHVLDQDKEKLASERKGCHEQACIVEKSLLRREMLLLMEKYGELKKNFEDMKVKTEEWRTERNNYLAQSNQNIEKLKSSFEDERQSQEKRHEALVRENTLLKSKCNTLEMNLENCKTKLIISYRRMAKLRKQIETDDALPDNKKNQLTKSRADKSVCEDEKLRETKNVRKRAKPVTGSFSEEEGKTKVIYEKQPSKRKNRSRKSKAAKSNELLRPGVNSRETENTCNSTVVQGTFSEQQGKTKTLHETPSVNGKGQSRKSKVGKRTVTFSLRDDVKLFETENACESTELVTGSPSNQQAKSEALYEKIHSLLNTPIPEEIDTFVNQVQELNIYIDTWKALQDAVDIVFEKAVNDSKYAAACALMCKELSNIEVVGDADDSSSANFWKLFVTRCQTEFEQNCAVNKESYNEKLSKIAKCVDPEKKKEVQLNFEQEDRKRRPRFVGNILLIGEMFKQNMVTCKIMEKCIRDLLNQVDDMNLECLCILLTTSGKVLEAKKINLSDHFKQIQKIVNDKDEISFEIRLMLQAVIDLKTNKWISPSYNSNTKLMDETKEKKGESVQIIENEIQDTGDTYKAQNDIKKI